MGTAASSSVAKSVSRRATSAQPRTRQQSVNSRNVSLRPYTAPPPRVSRTPSSVSTGQPQRNSALSASETSLQKPQDTEYISLDLMLPWKAYKDASSSDPSEVGYYVAHDTINNKLSVWSGDVTMIKVDALFNINGAAADVGMLSKVAEAAGPAMVEDIANQAAQGVNITQGHWLGARIVVHIYPSEMEGGLIDKGAVTDGFKQLSEMGCKTFAIPITDDKCVLNVILESTREWLEMQHQKVDMVVLCVGKDVDVDDCRNQVTTYFPVEIADHADDAKFKHEISAWESDEEEDDIPLTGTFQDPIEEVDEDDIIGTNSDNEDVASSNRGTEPVDSEHDPSDIEAMNEEDETACSQSEQGKSDDDDDEELSTNEWDEIPENDEEADNIYGEDDLDQWRESNHLGWDSVEIYCKREDLNLNDKGWLKVYKDQHFNFRAVPSVRFEGEEGIDAGGLSKTFFHKTLWAMVHDSTYFEGEVGHRIPCQSKVDLEREAFLHVGLALAHSAMHGGVGVYGLSPAVIYMLSHRVDCDEINNHVIPVVIQDVMDTEMRELLEKLDEADDQFIKDNKSMIQNYMIDNGIGQLPIKKENLQWIGQTIMLNEVITKRYSQINQMRKGMNELQLYDFLCDNPSDENIMRIFPPMEALDIKASEIIEKLQQYGEDEEQDENVHYKMFIQLLSDIEKGELAGVTLSDLLEFWTGCPRIPRGLSLSFYNNGILPVAHTCSYEIELPRDCENYEVFKEAFHKALTWGKDAFGIE